MNTNSWFFFSFLQSASLKKDSIQLEKPIMALKATNEGPRRVLIVASRNQRPVIRDAVTGLILRTISSEKNYTIYSLLRNNSLIYCGTSSTVIPVFDFTVSKFLLILFLMRFIKKKKQVSLTNNKFFPDRRTNCTV